MTSPIVFFDIAGPDDTELKTFYKNVFDWPCDRSQSFSLGKSSALQGSIRKDPAEKVLYIGVADITKTMDEIVSAGGTIDVPRFEVPGVVVLCLFFDPAGNKMGLVEMIDDKPRVP